MGTPQEASAPLTKVMLPATTNCCFRAGVCLPTLQSRLRLCRPRSIRALFPSRGNERGDIQKISRRQSHPGYEHGIREGSSELCLPHCWPPPV